jgi:hypothetical protein
MWRRIATWWNGMRTVLAVTRCFVISLRYPKSSRNHPRKYRRNEAPQVSLGTEQRSYSGLLGDVSYFELRCWRISCRRFLRYSRYSCCSFGSLGES